MMHGCELISNCIFTWAITSCSVVRPRFLLLWIDFKLYFYVSNHKEIELSLWDILVVNWFQIVFLREQSQVMEYTLCVTRCCELISNCIFTWAITSKRTIIKLPYGLWIDFKLYFYVSNHKKLKFHLQTTIVVNWFQIVFLREQSQGSVRKKQHIFRCELISNCIFTWAITSKRTFQLWT